jgi:hypothetical protein
MKEGTKDDKSKPTRMTDKFVEWKDLDYRAWRWNGFQKRRGEEKRREREKIWNEDLKNQ